MDYFYLDVETCPIDKEAYLSKSSDERKALLNPIDSKIIAIGLKKSGHAISIFQSEDEKGMLEAFWKSLSPFSKGSQSSRLVGFNVKNFDLPFLVTRSFICNAKIVPFLLKDVLDIREQLSAYKQGHARGKLKEFASLIGLEVMEGISGEDIAEQHWAGNAAKIKAYLKKDIEITEKIHQRIVELKIDEIQRW